MKRDLAAMGDWESGNSFTSVGVPRDKSLHPLEVSIAVQKEYKSSSKTFPNHYIENISLALNVFIKMQREILIM